MIRGIAMTLGALILAAGCGSSAGGGGVGIAFTGGNPGAGCLATAQAMGCVAKPGTAPPLYQVVSCDNATGTWKLVSECPSGQGCQETPDPANPQMKKAQCVDYGGGVGVDSGSTNDTVGGTGKDVAVSDGGSTPVDTAVADVTDSCSKCFPGQTCVNGVCTNPDPCDKCTSGQKCVDGTCVNKTQPCADGCPNGTYCNAEANGGKGACVSGSCQLPKAWTKNVQKLTSMAIADSGKGCDVDGDGKSDNVFGALKDIMPADSLQSAIKDGSVVILLEAPAWKTNGSSFVMGALSGELDQASSCNPTGPGCDCLVTESSYDKKSPGPLCSPFTLFDAKVIGGQLTAMATTPVVVPLPLLGTTSALNLHKAEVQGNVSGPSGWVSTSGGMLCGAIKQTELMDAVDAVPDEEFKALGVDKATAKALLGSLLQPDIDVDGDGDLESVSIALLTDTAAAQITGLTQ